MGFEFLRNQSALFLHGARGTDPAAAGHGDGGEDDGEDPNGGDDGGGVDLGLVPPALGGGGDSGRFATQYTASERSVGTTAPSEPYTSDDRYSQRGSHLGGSSARGGGFEHDYYDSGAPVQAPPNRLAATLEHAQLEDGVDLAGLRRGGLGGEDDAAAQDPQRPASPTSSEDSGGMGARVNGGRPVKSEGQLAAEDALRAMGVFLNPAGLSPVDRSTAHRHGPAAEDEQGEVGGSNVEYKRRTGERKCPSVESFTPTDGVMSDFEGSVKSRSTEADGEQEPQEADEAERDLEAEYGPMEDYIWPEEFGEVVTIGFLPGSIGMTFHATADGILVTEVSGAAAWVGVEVQDFIVEVNGRVLPADLEDGELYEMLLELPRPVQVRAAACDSTWLSF
jgi:hypothetical protein